MSIADDDSQLQGLTQVYQQAFSDSLTVGEIARWDLLSCQPDDRLEEAVRRMHERKVSSILVIEAGQPVGIWTERDTLALDLGKAETLDLPMRAVMSHPLRSAPASMALHELTQRFREQGVRHYLIEDGQRFGIVSLSDIVLNQGLEHYLRLRKVHSLVKKQGVALDAGASLAELLVFMRDHGRDAVIIDFVAAGVEADERYGIVTERDLVRVLAFHADYRCVGDVATRPLLTVRHTENLYRVRNIMAERKIRHIGVLDEDGELVDVVSFADILTGMELAYVHELKQALQETDHALRRSRDDLFLAQRVIDNSLEGIMVTDARGVIISVNPAFTRLTGYSEAEVLGQNPSILSSGRQSPAFYRRMWDSLAEHGYWQGELWNRRRNGEIYPELLHIAEIRNGQGELTHYTALFSDISRLKESEARIRTLAYYDPLTDLPNRRLLEDRLSVEISHATRKKDRLGVLFVDLDRFKRINDSLGHQAGDQVLKEVARRIRGSVREVDTVGRMGGDEFLVILGALERPEAAAATARRILTALLPPIETDGRELIITTSIGISIYPDDATDAATLVKNADVAMYRAKEQGRNSFQLFQPSMNARSLERLALQTALHGALAGDQFRLHFQPLIDTRTEELLAVEALLRWQHPVLGMIGPADFIPLAEESGLIISIGEWVLRDACRHLSQWLSAGRKPIGMMVNISARQFRQPDFVDCVAELLAEWQVPQGLLTFELTESILVEDVDSAVERMHALRALGIQLALDDFGTGYSSFAYLKELPVDLLKIDRLFIRGIDRNVRDAALVGGIVFLGKSLGMKVIAEGVETRAHLNVLQDQGCERAQGFYFCEPLPWDQLLQRYPVVLRPDGQ